MPTPPTETELKFALGPGARQALEAGLFWNAGVSDLFATYYDTADLALLKSGHVLRVRRKGQRFIQTLKSQGDGFLARGEWERDVPSPAIDANALSATPAAAVAAIEALRPIFDVEVQRAAIIITHGVSRIEAVLDTGEVRVGDRRDPVEELELELMEGNPRDLFAFARTLQMDVTLAFETKSERGYRLAGAAAPPAGEPEATLRALSEAIRSRDTAAASACASALGVAAAIPAGAGFDRPLWAGILLDAAERAGLRSADTPT